MAQSTTQQSSAIEETVSSMEEMAAMLTQTSNNAGEGLTFSEESQQEAERGREVILKMLTAMDEIQDSNEKLESIVKAINEIKQKTQVINDIVSETRLLSFNASIEAARAGSHGKGFAVVAEEVGNLASMSGKAAEEIRTLLENSTNEVDEIVKTTQKKVSDGKEISQNCQVAFESMSTSLNKIVNSIQMINSASKEQEAGVKQTNIAMNEMEGITQQNSNNSDVLAQKSSDLEINANDLQASVVDLKKIILGSSSHQETDSLNVPTIETEASPGNVNESNNVVDLNFSKENDPNLNKVSVNDSRWTK
ncbi:MAG: hypothetical protein HON90_09015 [Halobacteriovoraceae bacterium]|nr:hypothetical protein [Halobacteriovoraceae bacterium]